MKKLFALVLALMMAVGMMSFAMAEEDKPYIGILAPVLTHDWVGGVNFYAQQAADSLDIKYEFLVSTDAEEMSSNIETLISLGVDAIVVWPQFPGVETAAEKALANGIIIYNFDMIIEVAEEYADLMYVLTGNNYDMGYQGGAYIAEKLEGAGDVLILCKPTAGNVNDDRMQGFKDYIAEFAPDIEIIAEVASDFTKEAGLKDMADALTAYSHIDAVFSLDDGTSIGALQAIKEAGRTDIKAITGGGGCQEYFNIMLDEAYADIWVSSATYSPSMIISCVENAVAVLLGEEIEHLIVDPTVIIDRENAEEYLNPDSPY